MVAESHARSSGRLIAASELPERLAPGCRGRCPSARKEEPIQLDEFVAHIERELIRRALARAKGNKSKAARLLGIESAPALSTDGSARLGRGGRNGIMTGGHGAIARSTVESRLQGAFTAVQNSGKLLC